MASAWKPAAAEKYLSVTAVTCATLALLLLAVQHVLRPELNPISHVLSEYALGPLGWLQQLWFLFLAFGCLSLLVAIKPYAHGLAGWIGLLGLFAAVVGLAMAAVYPMDPLTVPIEQSSESARMHNVAAMIGNPGFLVGSILLSLVLRRQGPWFDSRRSLMFAAHLAWISFVLMVVAVAVAFSQQPQSPEANFIGVANRLLGVAYSLWLIAASLPLTQSDRTNG